MRVSYANKSLNYLLPNVSQLCMYERRVGHVIGYYRYSDSIVINSRPFKLVPFESFGAVSYSPSIVWLYLASVPR